MVTDLVKFSSTDLVEFQPVKVPALSSTHTAGLVHNNWEKPELTEFQHIFTGAHGGFQEWDLKCFKN